MHHPKDLSAPDSAAPVRTAPDKASDPPAARQSPWSSAQMALWADRASFLIVAAALWIVMTQGMLAGLLCAALAFLTTRALGRYLLAWTRLGPSAALQISTAFVVLAPLSLIFLVWTRARGLVLDAPAQYRELLHFLSTTILELREKLPPGLGELLPDGVEEIQKRLAAYLGGKAGTLAHASRAWLEGLLFAYVGLIIGALAAVRPKLDTTRLKPLAAAMHVRLTRFGITFRQIVVAQFWIAGFNTLLTTAFVALILPLWSVHLPYRPALITFTFLAGLIPIVGNLMCNLVLTIVGLSVSPITALACLVFLILIHKGEYFINAKVIGRSTHMGVWELLAVMFTLEAIFGPAGLVAAPLFYAYLKRELEAAGWI